MSSVVRNASHALSVSRSVSAKTWAIFGKAVFCETIARSAWPMPADCQKICQGKPGACAWSSARVIRL
jgi:hypothetical protein